MAADQRLGRGRELPALLARAAARLSVSTRVALGFLSGPRLYHTVRPIQYTSLHQERSKGAAANVEPSSDLACESINAYFGYSMFYDE